MAAAHRNRWTLAGAVAVGLVAVQQMVKGDAVGLLVTGVFVRQIVHYAPWR